MRNPSDFWDFCPISSWGKSMASVLLVDDDKDILRMAQAVLENSFYSVKSAPDVLSALEILRDYSFDLLISDANMPHYSGYDLIKTVRRDDKFKSMAIAMLTGRKEKQDIERAIRLGIDDYIIKPIDPFLFLKKVDNLIKNCKKEEKADVWLPQTAANSRGLLKLSIQIFSVSEEGLLVHTKYPLPIGDVVEFESALFDEMGVKPPQARIFSSEEKEPGLWESRLLFFAINDLTLQKIRAWMMGHASKAIRKTG